MVSSSTSDQTDAPAWSLKNPYTATVTARRALNGAGSAKDTQHIEIAIGDDGPRHHSGDSLGVLAHNDPELVQAIIDALGADGDEPVADSDGNHGPLRQILERRDIAKVNKPLCRLIADLGDPEMARLQEAEHKDELAEFRSGRDLLDMVTGFVDRGLTPTNVAGCLGKLAPRLYSIASSPMAHPGEVHLTVGVVHFEARGRVRKGVCSTYLGERCAADDTIECYVHHSKNFALPDDGATPIIMIGPGTGIAPFRAFLQERRATGASGRNWLFFGDQHRATDYLYGDEFAAMQQDGLLSRVDLAFSRDQDHKIYVQHKMAEAEREFWTWLEDGAHLYVCGDALRMAKDVDTELLRIAAEIGGLGEDGAKDYVKQLKKDKRYQRDVYAV